jgi:hypothetical protein
VLLVTHPRELLRLLARAARVLSFRLHASIPALSLGCEVADVAFDARSLTLRLFGVESIRLDEFAAGYPPRYATARDIDPKPIIARLRDTLNTLPEN